MQVMHQPKGNLSSHVDSFGHWREPISLTNYSVIFSYWTGMLDMISSALGPYISTLNLSMVRIDGSLTLQQRRDALDRFNSDKSCVVMLATIGAVGEGYVFRCHATASCVSEWL